MVIKVHEADIPGFYIRGFLVGILLFGVVLHGYESSCQRRYNVSDCDMTFVPDEVEVHEWLYP